MDNNFSIFGTIKNGFKYTTKNIIPISKELFISVAFLIVGSIIFFMPLSKLASNAIQSSILFNMVIGAVLITIGTWLALCSCLKIVYSLKENQNPVNYATYNLKLAERKKDFKHALFNLGKYYLLFAVPYLVAIFIIFISAILNMPAISILLIPILGIVYFILFFVLIHFMTKTFYILQIFAIEEDLNPKKIVKRCFELTNGHFWYTFGIFFILTIISFIPSFFGFNEIIAYIISFATTIVLIPITIVAGYMGYRKIIEKN